MALVDPLIQIGRDGLPAFQFEMKTVLTCKKSAVTGRQTWRGVQRI